MFDVKPQTDIQRDIQTYTRPHAPTHARTCTHNGQRRGEGCITSTGNMGRLIVLSSANNLIPCLFRDVKAQMYTSPLKPHTHYRRLGR